MAVRITDCSVRYHQFYLTVVKRSTALGAIGYEGNESRAIRYVNVRIDWVVVGGDGFGDVHGPCGTVVAPTLDCLSAVGICIE